MSLRLKIIILFLVVVLLPLLFVASLTFSNSRDLLRHSILSDLNAINKTKENEVFSYIEKLKTRTADFSSDGFIRIRLEEIMNGKEFAREKLVFHLLHNKKSLSENLISIDIYDLYGNLAASTSPQKSGINAAKEAYFTRGLREICLNDIYYDNGIPVLTIAAPLKKNNPPHKTIGVIVNSYNVSLLNAYLSDKRPPGENELGLSGVSGSSLETYLVNENKIMITESELKKGVSFNQQIDTYPVKEALENNKESNGIWADYRGKKVVGSSTIMDLGDFKWILISEQDAKEAFDPINKLRQVIFFITVIVMLTVAAIAASLAQSISRPVQELQKGVKIIGGGNLDYKVEIKEKNELGGLAESFNSMAENIKTTTASRDELREEIITRKKLEAKLIESRYLAEKATRAKSKFLANMSHELRTPLNSIIGFSEILRDETFGPLNEKQNNYVNNVISSGNHLLLLINDLLDIAKIEAERLEIQPSEFYLKALLENCLLLVKEHSLRHNIALSIDIAEDIEKISADERKVKQIIFNLLSNAGKFTPDGGKIGIKAVKKGNYYEISVWDTGIGIAKENMDKIFEEFAQVDNPYTKIQQGTGLGLALVKKLVELHGGKIKAESEGEGAGSIFKFTLPVKKENSGGNIK